MQLIKKFLQAERGTLMVPLAIMLPLLAAAAGGAVDYSNAMSRSNDLQKAVDAAALATARSTAGEPERKKLAQNIFEQNFAECAEDIDTVIGEETVEVSATCQSPTTLLQLGGIKDIEISGYAKAGYADTRSHSAAPFGPCVLALQETRTSIVVNGTADITADCGWHTNSKDRSAFVYNGTGVFRVPTFSAVGKVHGINNGGFHVDVINGAAPIPDPLADMPPPAEVEQGCDYTDFGTNGTDPVVAYPGVYCGGFRTNGTGNITLNKGTYVIRDGHFSINGTGTLTGEEVLIYLEPGASFTFNGSGGVRLTAPTEGTHAGFVLMQAYDESVRQRSATFNMSNGSYIEGTIYLPRHKMTLNGSSHTNYAAKYTKIIVHTLTRNGGGSFRLGSDYTSRSPLPTMLRSMAVPKRVVRLMR